MVRMKAKDTGQPEDSAARKEESQRGAAGRETPGAARDNR